MTESVLTFRQKIEFWDDLIDLQNHLSRDELIGIVNDRDFLRDVLREMKSKNAPHSERAIYLGKMLERSIEISGE